MIDFRTSFLLLYTQKIVVVIMPAVSKAQQAVMGMALAARRGEMKVSELSDAALKIYKSDMTDKQIEDFASTSKEGLPTHKMKTLKESILSSTGTGAAMTEKFLNDHLKPSQWKKNDDGTYFVKEFTISQDEVSFPINRIDEIELLIISDAQKIDFTNFPKVRWMSILNSTIDSFDGLKSVQYMNISNCDIKNIDALKNIHMKYLSIGNNKQHYSVKEIMKLTGLKPDQFNTIGTFNGKRYKIKQGLIIGDNDIKRVKEIVSEYENILKKKCPSVQYIKVNSQSFYDRVDMYISFITESEIPNQISRNGIYSFFIWNLADNSLENSQNGHLELTDADKQGKYKYYALKSLIDPYLAEGGKKFRKCRMNEFSAKDLDNKMTEWICAVIDAALKDQGGVLKRR